MLKRYTTLEMAELWSDEAKFQRWLAVELAVLEARAELGDIPKSIPHLVRENAKIDIQRIDELEEKLRHDMNAFLAAVSETIPEEARPYLHYGLTSYDIEDTALALALHKSTELILGELAEAVNILAHLAGQYRNTIQIGRTHGMHAEPITFGFKMLNWYDILRRHQERIWQLQHEWFAGKISGAVGTYAHVSRAVEELACAKLKIGRARIATQIVSRERHALYLSFLASLASSLAKFETDIRLMAQTEIGEVKEGRVPEQMGSSAMPHKSSLEFTNPILSENGCSLARMMRHYAAVGFENQETWHERDLTNSANERIILADASTLMHFMLGRFTSLMRDLQIFPQKMRENLWSTGGAIFSQRVMLVLQECGISRTNAHNMVSGLIRQAEREGKSFMYLAVCSEMLAVHLTEDEIKACFDVQYYLRNIDKIFADFSALL